MIKKSRYISCVCRIDHIRILCTIYIVIQIKEICSTIKIWPYPAVCFFTPYKFTCIYADECMLWYGFHGPYAPASTIICLIEKQILFWASLYDSERTIFRAGTGSIAFIYWYSWWYFHQISWIWQLIVSMPSKTQIVFWREFLGSHLQYEFQLLYYVTFNLNYKYLPAVCFFTVGEFTCIHADKFFPLFRF